MGATVIEVLTLTSYVQSVLTGTFGLSSRSVFPIGELNGHFEYLVTLGDSRYCEVIACSFRLPNLLL